MNKSAWRAALLLSLAVVLGCGNPDQPGTPSGGTDIRLDAVATTGTPADPGALLGLTMNSQVGVNLDELPASMRARVAADLIAKPQDFWKKRAMAQVRLAQYRLVFREFFYGGKQKLPLPPETIWNFTLNGTPTRTTVNGHDLVMVPFTFTSTVLTDVASPGISENKLAKVGGTWDEPYSFPIDPELVFQRTGYACMDEEDFPYNSVDSEETDTFYDDTCTPNRTLTSVGQCHQTEQPTMSCKDALDAKIGRVNTNLHFERLPWNAAVANAVRVYPPTTNTADLEVYQEDFHEHRIEYKYFAPNSCEMVEQCIGGPGWRRVLQFNSVDQNRGKQTIDIGAVDYYLTGKTTLNDQYHIFEFSSCHNHYHFTHYGEFGFDAPGASTTHKQGFCLQSTQRTANNEFSPLPNPYGGCDYQGIAAGWADQYKIGLPCQWVDITNVATTGNVSGNLSFHSNPDGFLCEGTPVLDANGNPVFEPTNFTSADGGTVYRPKCTQSPGAANNNLDSYPVTVPKAGDTYVTEACTRGQVGPLRNCGWKKAIEKLTCTPGAQVTVRCSVNPTSAAPQVARICERSQELNTAIACIQRFALASQPIEAGSYTDMTLTCPAARSATEPGGQISVYAGAAYPGDAAAPISCTVLP